MYRRISDWSVMPVLLVVVLAVLALGACGGGGEAAEGKAKGREDAGARTLPSSGALRPGEYRTGEFEPPFTLKVGKGWSVDAKESGFLNLSRPEEAGFLRFANIEKVYEPGTQKEVKAPKDLVGWLQRHLYLETGRPEPTTVGGVEGEQMDVLVEDLPQDFVGRCGVRCVDIAPMSGSRQSVYFRETNKRRITVLKNVNGATVTVDFAAPVALFDEFAPDAQKVVDTVRWEGS